MAAKKQFIKTLKLWFYMHISDLELVNFRNHKSASVIFTTGINVIVGNNGVGKTNIVEAIDFLGFAKSFRTRETKALVEYNANKAHIIATIHNPGRTDVEIEIAGNSKKIFINGKSLSKVSLLTKYVRTTTFQPEDVLFFDESPIVRRKFLDANLVKSDEMYLEAIARYEKLLKERNATLKSGASEEMLDLIDSAFVETGMIVSKKRNEFIKSLTLVVNEVLQKLSDDKLHVKLRYEKTMYEEVRQKEANLEKLKALREKEKILQTTTLGPHRDDVSATLNGKNVKEHASQGQKRLIAIALKLAPYYLTKEEHKKPIIILDDVLSELDATHQARLIDVLLLCNQVFITATEYKNYAHSRYEISDEGTIRRTS